MAAPRVTEYDASPDIATVAYSLRTLDGDHFTSDVYLIDPDYTAVQRLTANPGHDRFPALSPDGSHLAYIAETPANPAELRVMNLTTRMVKQLGDLRVIHSQPQWLPQGDRLVFVARAQTGTLESDLSPSSRIDGNRSVRVTEDRLGWRDIDARSPHLLLLDTQTMTVVDLTPSLDAPLSDIGFEWDLSPGGTKIVYSVIGGTSPYRTFQHDLFLLDLGNRSTTPLTETTDVSEVRPIFASEQEIVFGQLSRPNVESDHHHLVSMNLITRETNTLLASDAIDPTNWMITRTGHLWLDTLQDGSRQIYKLDRDSGKTEAIPSSHSLSEPRASGSRMLAIAESFDKPPHLVDVSGGAVQALTSHHSATVRPPVRWQRFTITGSDGPLSSWLVLPTDTPPAAGWPLLVLLHGGPYSTWVNGFHPRWNAALFANQGFAVLLPEFHGSAGHGQAFADAILADPATRPAQDVDSLVAALSRRSWVSNDKAILVGPSYGGYLAAWLLVHSDRFKTAIIHSGVFDLGGQFASDVTWTRANSYGATPWTNWRHLIDRSPLSHAHNINEPVLLLHGESDIRVPVTQSLAFHEALINNGTRSRLALFPNAGHVLTRPNQLRAWWREVVAWLDSQQNAVSTQ